MPQNTPYDPLRKTQIVDALNRLQTLLAETIDEQYPTIQARIKTESEVLTTGRRYIAFETEITILDAPDTGD